MKSEGERWFVETTIAPFFGSEQSPSRPWASPELPNLEAGLIQAVSCAWLSSAQMTARLT